MATTDMKEARVGIGVLLVRKNDKKVLVGKRYVSFCTHHPLHITHHPPLVSCLTQPRTEKEN